MSSSDPDALSYIESGPQKDSEEEKIIQNLLSDAAEAVSNSLQNWPVSDRSEYIDRLKTFLLQTGDAVSSGNAIRFNSSESELSSSLLSTLESEQLLNDLEDSNPLIHTELQLRQRHEDAAIEAQALLFQNQQQLDPNVAQNLAQLPDYVPLIKFDLSSYQSLEGPSQDKQHDSRSWKQCLDRLKTNQEYTNWRISNLDLLTGNYSTTMYQSQQQNKNSSISQQSSGAVSVPGQSNGVKASINLKRTVQHLEKSILTTQLDDLNSQQDSTNQSRKIKQIMCQKTLREKKVICNRYMEENRVLEQKALPEMRKEVERLKRIAKRRKVINDDWKDESLKSNNLNDEEGDSEVGGKGKKEVEE